MNIENYDDNDLQKFLFDNEELIFKKYMENKKSKIYQLYQENNVLKNEIIELKQVINLDKKRIGDHSMYKGEFQEKKMEIILKEYLNQKYEIIGEKHMKCMDIRIKHKVKDYLVGIECKYKKKITKQDIDKFKSDKVTNKFKSSIFLSTSAPIKNYVEIINSYKILNDELYIYSSDEIYIIMILQHFLNFIENNEEDKITIDKCIDHTLNLYTNWNNIKKCCLKMDNDMVTYLESINLKLDNGHLYLTTKNKCKNNKNPYTISENENKNVNIDKKSEVINNNFLNIETEILKI